MFVNNKHLSSKQRYDISILKVAATLAVAHKTMEEQPQGLPLLLRYELFCITNITIMEYP